MKTVFKTLLTLFILCSWGVSYLLMLYPSDITSWFNEDLVYEANNWLIENIYIIDNLFLFLTGALLIMFYIFGYNDGKKNTNNSNIKDYEKINN